MADPVLPPPPPPKGKRPGDGDILVLLVGINDYASINDLSGCVADLDRVESYLKKRYGIPTENKGVTFDVFGKSYAIPILGYRNLKIYRLEDEHATYQNIIDAFRAFLQPAGVADRVWFHFSGHGTEAPTAAAFAQLENNKDQCLMCHDCIINEETGEYDKLLADKEIAVLLNEIAAGDAGMPHIVVTIDSCHSGGLSRDPSDRIRNIEVPANAKGRWLNSYLNGYYSDQQNANEGKPLSIPTAPHIIITACNNLQLAGESSGGYFTNGLIDTLESVNGDINYSDLLIRTRHAVKLKRASQTPQFEVMGGNKAYTRFLEGTPAGRPDKYEVKFHNGDWTVACGQIQGLSTTASLTSIATAGNQPIELDVYDFDAPTKIVAKASIKEVGPQYSTITVKEAALNNLTDGILEVINEEKQSSSTEESTARSAAEQKEAVLDKFPTSQLDKITNEIVEKFSKENLTALTKDILGAITTSSLAKTSSTSEDVSKKSINAIVEAQLAEVAETQVRAITSRMVTDVTDRVIGGITQGKLSSAKSYFAKLNYFPAEPEYVLINGTAAATKEFTDNWITFSEIGNKNILFITEADSTTPHSIEVAINSDGYQITDNYLGKPVDKEYELSTPNEVLIDLIQIVNWRRLVNLENTNPNSSLRDKIKLNTNLSNKKGDNILEEGFEGAAISITVSKDDNPFILDDPNERYFNLMPNIKIESTGKPLLYCYLFSLWSWYEITAEDERKHESSEAGIIKYPIDPERNWGLGGTENKDTLHYKLIITEEELDYHQLLQKGIDRDKGRPKSRLPEKSGFKDWCAITMKIDLVREEALVLS